MGKACTVFRRDLKRLITNPIAFIVAIGVCVVPCLYAWINILANWDPYENTSTVPVAIVNEDLPAYVSEDVGEVCVGDMLEEKLAENDKIGWRFEGEDQAIEEVRAGTAYAAIVIPPDFTETLTGVLDGKTDKARLTYYVNEKVNAVSPKVTDTGASTIETTIDEQFIAVVGRTISEKLGTLAHNIITDSHDTAESVTNALEKTKVALGGVTDELDGIVGKIAGAQESLADATTRLSELQGKGTELASSVQTTLDGFSDTRTRTGSLADDLDASLGDGASSVSSVSTRASLDVTALAVDLRSASAQIDDAIRALENDLTDSRALESRIRGTRDLTVSFDPLSDPARAIKVELERQLTPELDLMAQLTAEQEAKVEELRGIAARIEGASAEVEALSQTLDGEVQGATDTLLGARTGSVATSVSQASAALDTFVSVATRLEAAARLVDPIVTGTLSVAESLKGTFQTTATALSGTKESVGELVGDLDGLQQQLLAISASEAWSVLTSLATTNPEGIHDFLTAPVAMNETRLYPIENYASGIAPFFTSLSIWVAGIAFVAIFKLEVDEDGVGRLKPWQAYVGRWALFVLLGLVQAAIVVSGDLALGVQCTYVWALYLSALVSSFAFVSIIFSLSVAFKHLGKALAFTLVILQVPGSSGMYPIEMMPPFFRAVGPWLPFTYSNSAMREAIGGLYGTDLARNLATLLLFVLPSVLVGITCRSHLVNINALFDRRLRETDHLMISEPTGVGRMRFRLATVVKAAYAPAAYREAIERRAAAFERAYPLLVRRGIRALLLLPPVLLVLACVVEERLPLIAALVVALVGIYAYLIVVEYLHERVRHKMRLTEYSTQELAAELTECLREEVLATAPIDSLLEAAGHERPHERVARRIHERIEDLTAARGTHEAGDGQTRGGDGLAEDDTIGGERR